MIRLIEGNQYRGDQPEITQKPVEINFPEVVTQVAHSLGEEMMTRE
jgi:hypothetical protein